MYGSKSASVGLTTYGPYDLTINYFSFIVFRLIERGTQWHLHIKLSDYRVFFLSINYLVNLEVRSLQAHWYITMV